MQQHEREAEARAGRMDHVRFWPRVLVTIGALLAYRLGCHIPLYGYDADALAELYRTTSTPFMIDRLSIFALGVIPILSALALGELLAMFVPALSAWRTAAFANEGRYQFAVLSLSLLLAAFQGWSISSALEDIPNLVAAPGFGFKISTIITYAGATAALAWLATVITRYGTGSGLWVLAVLPLVMELAPFPDHLKQVLEAGTTTANSVALAALFVIATAGSLVVQAKDCNTTRCWEAFIWPPLLAYFLFPWLIAPYIALAPHPDAIAITQWLVPGHPFRLLLLPLLAILLTVWRAKATSVSSGAPNSGRRLAGIAIAIAGCVLAGELLVGYLAIPLPTAFSGHTFIILVIVSLSILKGARTRPAIAISSAP